jgi:hypothetical protein
MFSSAAKNHSTAASGRDAMAVDTSAVPGKGPSACPYNNVTLGLRWLGFRLRFGLGLGLGLGLGVGAVGIGVGVRVRVRGRGRGSWDWDWGSG